MGIVFNPLNFTGLDFVGSGGSSPTGPAERYLASFNNTSDWTLSSGYYELTVLAGTHGKGTNPNVRVAETISGVDEIVNTVIKINTSGDVVIQVTASPDNRFNGKILII